jgi:SAM-dependent methyltransferase
MEFDHIKKYWEERALTDGSPQSTTQDYYLREIEFRVLRDAVNRYKPTRVMDIGCGDARTTARLATEFERIRFIAGDYSESMVRNARHNIILAGLSNVTLTLCDVSKSLPVDLQEMIYSTRCLINLPSWELQRAAISNIADRLAIGGTYVMIENFLEGHDNFNRFRREFGLPEIPIRNHNLFFVRERLIDFVSTRFDIFEEVNISSTYYIVSRGVYSRMCQDANADPDYFDVHHKYAAQLPFCGEFGPVRMMCLRRK